MLGTAPLLSVPSLVTASTRRNMRLAYFTDLHLPACNKTNTRAIKAFDRASDSDFFLFGGDNVMCIDNQPEELIAAQFDNFHRFATNHVRKPFRSILGNHDIETGILNDKSHFCGKRRTVDLYNMKDRNWVENIGGWRVIGLDTVQKWGKGYIGRIDHEQMRWLAKVLESDRKTPTIVLGHIPFLSVTPLADKSTQCRPTSMPISFCSTVSNSRDIVKLFRQAGNVKLCLSGHTHMNDRCEFGGTTYVCAGAVSGSWWRGDHQGFAPSYTQIDLHEQGEFNLKTIHWDA